MSVNEHNSKLTRVEKNTPGGDTYYVHKDGEKAPRPMCYRRLRGRPDERCEKVAGHRTDHLYYGACRQHGGDSGKAQRLAGLSGRVNTTLKHKITHYLHQDRDTMLDLTQELAKSRAVLDQLTDNFPELSYIGDDENADKELGRYFAFVKLFNETVGTLSRLVDNISRIDNRNAITAAQVIYLKATVADLLLKYISDPREQESAVQELQARLGGDTQTVEVEAREIPSHIT